MKSKKHKNPKPSGPRPSLFGLHAVREAWLNPKRHVQALYLTENSADTFAPFLKEAKHAGLKRPEPSLIDKKELDKMLPNGAVHQNIALACSPLEDVFLQDLIISAPDNALILILDQVTDPHNVGAILRSASAFGAHGVIMQKKHAPALDGVLAKTASGAVDHIDVAFETNLSRAIEELKAGGFFVFGLDERGSRDLHALEKDKPGKLALVLGAEGPGMRRLVKEHCDELIKLPTSGAILSLNVSNAAAISLYALTKK